ncbi:hypothetical protein [Pseudozobellia sp. WGM2]|uniref:hypothetical protein n=1 Tax=Pseudozobellia sp. WGM2 TaxID=2787625 RepID=UPI001AE0D83E|nr:hypothetical protein [Pseudozobellia sp. WGM2]
MGKLLKPLFGIFLVAILQLSLGILSIPKDNSFAEVNPHSKKELFVHHSQVKFNCALLGIDISGENVAVSPLIKSKNPFDFQASVKHSEKFYLAKHRSYIKFSKQLLIRLRKCDIIFPFHYFW